MTTKKAASKKISSKKSSKLNGGDVDAPKLVKISQTVIPSVSLQQALRIPQAIADSYAYKPSTPAQVARALDMNHQDRNFRRLSGAAIGYGLVIGGSQSNQIALTPIGERIVKPKVEGDDLLAQREAFLKPRIISQFLKHYDGASLPRENIARNVLVDMDVPVDRTAAVYKLIVDGAKGFGLAAERDGKIHIDLKGTLPQIPQDDAEGEEEFTEPEDDEDVGDGGASKQGGSLNDVIAPIPERDNTQSLRTSKVIPQTLKRRVFITHGKNRAFIDTIKRLLKYGELEAVVAAERQTVSQPVPDKVMNDMRSCGAAIIHVDAEQVITDKDGKEHVILNPNVVMEIGGAMALYGRRFILLVKEGVTLPSNTQGLYEVRYTGDNLDADVAFKLLDAINDIKNHPLPERYVEESGSPQLEDEAAKK